MAGWSSYVLLRDLRWSRRITVHQVTCEVVTKQKRRRANPSASTVPSFHVRRSEEQLSHLHHGILRNSWRREIAFEKFCCLNKKLDRTLNVRVHCTLGKKLSRTKDFPENWTNLIVFRAESAGHGRDDLARRFIFDKESPKFLCNEFGTCRLFHQDINHVIAVPRTGFFHKSLWRVIVLITGKLEILRSVIKPVSREGPSRLANVLFRVMSNANRE